MGEFGKPENLIWLWLALPVTALIMFGLRFRLKRLKAFSNTHFTKLLSGNLRRWRFGLKAALALAALISIVIALAQPRWGYDWEEVKTSGVDIMVAVDVSRSMLAQDIRPTRLERAKRKVRDLLRMAQGDRIGLIAFAGTAFVQCPLTVDYGALDMFLDYLNPDLISRQGTAIGEAIDLATTSLKEFAPESTQGKALIIITDGEDQDQSSKAAIDKAKEAGIKIFTMGVGKDEGAPIPEAGGGFKQDSKGNVVLTKPNLDFLKDVAEDTGGVFVESTTGDADLQRIYADGIKASIEDSDTGQRRQKLWHERFQWFVMLALVGLFLEGMITDYSRSKKSKVKSGTKAKAADGLKQGLLIVLLGMILIPHDVFASDIKGARKAFDKGDFKKAEEEFLSAEIDDPSNLENTFNRAVSQYRQGKFEDASKGFLKASESKDKDLAANSMFNLGNAEASAKKYDEAIEAYKKTLEMRPNDAMAKENLEYVTKLKEQNPEDQKNKDDKNKDQNEDKKAQQDKQNQDQQNKGDQQKQDSKDENQDNKDKGQQDKQDQEEQKNQDQQQSQGKEGDKGKDEKDKQPQGAEGNEQKDQKPGEQQQVQQGEGQPAKEISKEQAEMLLRGVEDKAQKYMGSPMMKNEKMDAKKVEKDW